MSSSPEGMPVKTLPSAATCVIFVAVLFVCFLLHMYSIGVIWFYNRTLKQRQGGKD